MYTKEKGATMVNEQKILINRINTLCKKRGTSYYMLAHRAGVPMSTLMHIIDGSVKNPGIFTLIRICGALEVTPSEFFNTGDFSKMKDMIKKEE